jgi:hypothetical protein
MTALRKPMIKDPKDAFFIPPVPQRPNPPPPINQEYWALKCLLSDSVCVSINKQ